MKVTKVDIVTEQLDIQNDRQYLKFVKVSPLHAILKEDENPQMPENNCIEERYEIIRTYFVGENHRFAVKTDDRKIFNDLINITAHTVSRFVDDKTSHLTYEIQYLRDRINHMKSLPWYKRLFKIYYNE